MADMQELIARLEAAEAGSRELDCLVDAWRMGLSEEVEFRTVGLPTYEAPRYFCGPKAMDWIGYDLLRTSPAYTTSLDAALALADRVLPGYEVSVAQRKPRHLETCAEWWHASLFKIRTGVVFDAGPGTISIKSATPALALCIAILKAKAQGEGG